MSLFRVLPCSLVLACGPIVDANEITGDVTETMSTSGPVSSDGREEGPTTGTTSGPGSSTSAHDASGSSTGDDLIVPPGNVYSQGSCQPDGLVMLYVEAWLDGGAAECLPAPDVDLDNLVLVGLNDWDGFSGIFEVGPTAPARAVHGMEDLEGTLTLKIWAPYHPTSLHLSVSGPSAGFDGTLDLALCHHPAPECGPAETTGTGGDSTGG